MEIFANEFFLLLKKIAVTKYQLILN